MSEQDMPHVSVPTEALRRVQSKRGDPVAYATAFGEARHDALHALEKLPKPPHTSHEQTLTAYAIRTLQLLADEKRRSEGFLI